MPVLRYFVVAGTGLLFLLFAASAYLPAPPVTDRRDASAVDKTTIRISGDKPVAERVTIDTSVPTITPPVAEPSVAQSDSQNDSSRDALARMEDTPPIAVTAATPSPPVRKAAVRKHPKRPAVVIARPAGLFDLW